MSRFNQWFERKEFECKCGCGQNTVDAELLQVLTDLRVYSGCPIIINSANRCWHHNEVIGGSSKSQHPLGKASDIVVKGWTIEEVYRHLDEKYPHKYGIGFYDSFIHIDVRANRARWTS